MKYYKGLGTSNSADFKEYFADMKQVKFICDQSTDDVIDKIFNKSRADERKLWIESGNRESFLDTSRPEVTYNDFVDKELIHFSTYDCARSLPSSVDGLKISLRKILFCAFKRRLTAEIKVAQFSGYVSEHSGYHHGEASLNAGVYTPVLDLMADHQPRSLGDLEAELAGTGITFAQLLQVVVVLTGAGHLLPVVSDAAADAAATTSARANAWLMQRARGSADISYLASPVSGGGVAVGRFHQLFLLALLKDQQTPAALAQFVWDVLEQQNRRVLKDGATLESVADNLAELTREAEQFHAKVLPVLKALRVAP
jgi:hypothetical protein